MLYYRNQQKGDALRSAAVTGLVMCRIPVGMSEFLEELVGYVIRGWIVSADVYDALSFPTLKKFSQFT